ncbi:MAG: hypothetical protein ACR2O1_01285 [Boseongicola sp.]
MAIVLSVSRGAAPRLERLSRDSGAFGAVVNLTRRAAVCGLGVGGDADAIGLRLTIAFRVLPGTTYTVAGVLRGPRRRRAGWPLRGAVGGVSLKR